MNNGIIDLPDNSAAAVYLQVSPQAKTRSITHNCYSNYMSCIFGARAITKEKENYHHPHVHTMRHSDGLIKATCWISRILIGRGTHCGYIMSQVTWYRSTVYIWNYRTVGIMGHVLAVCGLISR